jgi:hypothetical protein
VVPHHSPHVKRDLIPDVQVGPMLVQIRETYAHFDFDDRIETSARTGFNVKRLSRRAAECAVE